MRIPQQFRWIDLWHIQRRQPVSLLPRRGFLKHQRLILRLVRPHLAKSFPFDRVRYSYHSKCLVFAVAQSTFATGHGLNRAKNAINVPHLRSQTAPQANTGAAATTSAAASICSFVIISVVHHSVAFFSSGYHRPSETPPTILPSSSRWHNAAGSS